MSKASEQAYRELTVSMSQTPEEAHCELSFAPNVSLVTTVRRFVSSFYVQVLTEGESTSKVAVATHELLENAVRYSADGQTSIRIHVQREGGRLSVRIHTKNRSHPAHIKVLASMLDAMKASPDPVAHYQELMRRSLKRTEGAGLGLGRIRSEADMDVGYEIEGDVVHLSASAKFEDEAAS